MAHNTVLVFLVAALCQMHSGETTSLLMEPETFVQGVTPNLTITCTPGDTISLLSNIAVFQLSKDGVLLATGKPGAVTLKESLRTSKYSGTDEIDLNNLSNAYLLFTIQFPEEEDEGQYKCDMNYQDKDGFFQHASQTVVLHQNDTDGINMQRRLDQTRVLVDNLMTRINKLETQVFGLTVENKNQSTRIAELTDKAASHIGFFVSLADKMTILQDDVILFDSVKFNNGSGYNATSGVFVAPFSGFYVLNLVLEVRSDAALRMEMLLNVNDTSVMKLFIAGETNSLGGHQQSGSLVYHLPAGSEVKVVVGVIVTETDSAPVQMENENLSYFSGYYLG